MEQGAKLTGTIELFQEAVAIAMWDIGASLPSSPRPRSRAIPTR